MGRLTAMPCRSPHGAMSDGRSHEMLAWLRRLPPPDRLAMMYAIAEVFPIIRIVPAWTTETNAALAELTPTSEEHDEIMTRGSRIGRRLKRRLKADEPDR
jgi:hypothetical protein